MLRQKWGWNTREERLALSIIILLFTACSQDQDISINYVAYNHTNIPIDAIIINGRGGILSARPYSTGGGVCCVTIPSKWHPGIGATIRWQRGGHWARDPAGQIVEKNGHKEFIEGEWRELLAPIPKYSGGDEIGDFRVHFFPNDEVKITILPYGPGHLSYPYPYPTDVNSR